MYAMRMIRPLGRFTPLVSFSLINKEFVNDVDLLNKPPKDAPKTGWERVKKMYSRDEYDDISLEITNVLQSTFSATFIGACIGGFVYTKSAYVNFVESNQATIYKSTAEAKKRLQDYVTVRFATGAVRWGWRLGLFTGMFSLTATTVAVYRGDTSVVDYITAGAIAGGLYKMNLGLAATLVGSGLGAALGAIFGTTIIAILHVSGLSMDDVRKTLKKLKDNREDHFKQAMEKESTIKNDALTHHHDDLVKEKGTKSLADL